MKKVLVVDDEFLMRFSLSAVLKGEHIKVTAVETGESALGEIARAAYDVCFLDLRLPDVSGMEVMKKIQEISPDTRIAVMTGSDYGGEQMAPIKKYAQLFLEKPFDLQEARRFVEQSGENSRDASTGQESFMNWLACNRRSCERTMKIGAITGEILDPETRLREREFNAVLVDSSPAGIGIVTRFPLMPGQLLRHGEGDSVRTGVVRWSQTAIAGTSYRAGVHYEQ